MSDRRMIMKSELAVVNEKLKSTGLSKVEKGKLMMEQSILGQGVQSMSDGIRELGEMGKKEDVSFHFKAHDKGDGGIEAYRDSKDDTGITSFTIGYQFGGRGNRVHETKHAYDLWKNTFGDYSPQWSGNSRKTDSFLYRKVGDTSSQYLFEHAAYKRQFHFDPSTSPVDYNQLNPKGIKALNPTTYKW